MKRLLAPGLVLAVLTVAVACGSCRRVENRPGDTGSASEAGASGSTASGMNGPVVAPAPAPQPGPKP